jgi:hypothetical protein
MGQIVDPAQRGTLQQFADIREKAMNGFSRHRVSFTHQMPHHYARKIWMELV